ncbi:DEAD/DEAH box helicase domain protein [Pseudopedobacter saltans DSM 12145]|uniref:DEAD/DEAH box helicase domain protein n=1 Tax=Pseudopedobacter saltans (strain ATCC 51119 / DSM 12145 / JCM 21818 / CCUG 39354 / LMG 10337 / NBRC 100064 / NCIMB 13643) TaxID=762903 RepID=F0SDQ0_PSESL|nr:DEAD/DEAH box helicase [Pseudopedobacter saltans]ADY50777.1 DEAD/DEAH box helicase domain protein [Pseudopedobacter saltans DSM 12145]
MIEKLSPFLQNIGITQLNEMQLEAITALEKNKNLLLLSPTGSGKTLAFLLPLFLRLDVDRKGVQAIVVVPSRELALQIEQVFKALQTGLKVTCCYGGHSAKIEASSLLNDAPTLIIATPGRLAFHIREGNFDVSSVRNLALDEFDKSLELGFEEEITFIVDELFKVDGMILTSATQFEELPAFIASREFFTLSFLKNEEHKPSFTTEIIQCKSKDKLRALLQLLCKYPNESTLVFCNFREATERVYDMLTDKGISAVVYHGGLDQQEREKALMKFRNGTSSVIVNTDLASRGLDIPDVQHVIHYQLPLNEESFIHRNGRTGRMKAEGLVHLLLSEEEYKPEYITDYTETDFEEKELPLPSATNWITFYIAAGKKDKISKMDIAGLFYKKAFLERDDLGMITLQDKMSYVAVKRDKAREALSKVKNEKIKGKKYRIGIDG